MSKTDDAVAAARAEGAEAMREACAQHMESRAAGYDNIKAGVTKARIPEIMANEARDGARSIRALPIPAAAALHPDDQAVTAFAAEMRAKLAACRAKGRGGWDDPSQCSTTLLADLLLGHCAKTNAGNCVDIANLAMMLHLRGATSEVADALARRDAEMRREGMLKAAEIAAAREQRAVAAEQWDAATEARDIVAAIRARAVGEER